MDKTELTTWLVILDRLIIPLIVVLLTPWLHYVTKKLLTVLEERTSIKVTEQQAAVIQAIMVDAIAYAEEQAHKRINGVEGKMSGAQKLSLAIDYTRDRSKELGLDKLAEAKSAQIQEQLEAKLAQRFERSKPKEIDLSISKGEGPQLLTEG